MRLRTVSVPPALVEHFSKLEELVSRYFQQRADAPERGTIEIFGDRYVLVRAASLSVEFFSLVRDLYGPGRRAEADAFARNILFDLAHALGRSDARKIHQRLGLEDSREKIAAGAIHFSHMGWAFVEIHPGSGLLRSPFGDTFDHPYSFEAAAWLEAGLQPDFPVCIMSAGYSSGWAEESFGVPLVASEMLCRARGDATCRFIMSDPEHAEEDVEGYLRGRAEPPAAARGLQVPDFFARKRMEDELRKARDALEQRVEERTSELRKANQRLRREMELRHQMEQRLLQTAKLEAIGSLAGGIAHDLNNLMGVVMGHVTLMARRAGGANDELLGSLREMRAAAERAVQLNHQLLDFARMRRTELTLVDLDSVVRETARMLERVLGEDVELVLELAGGLDSVQADRAQLSQVITNLALNARDAMPSGGQLRISTSAVEIDERATPGDAGLSPGRWVSLIVTDTGVGMDEETAARAFDPFFTTKEVGHGTGLGLPSVYGIVTQSGGVIRMSSCPGRGTTVQIHLPARPTE